MNINFLFVQRKGKKCKINCEKKNCNEHFRWQKFPTKTTEKIFVCKIVCNIDGQKFILELILWATKQSEEILGSFTDLRREESGQKILFFGVKGSNSDH